MPVQCCPRWSRHTVRHSFGEDEHERLQENPRRDRRPRHARRDRPRLHPGLRQWLRLRLWLRLVWRVWLQQPTLVRLQQLFLLRLQLLWLWPSELRLWLRPPLLVTAEFPGFHPLRQALAAADAAWAARASGGGSPGSAYGVPQRTASQRTRLTREPSRA